MLLFSAFMTDTFGIHKVWDGKGDFATRGISRNYNESKVFYRLSRSRTKGIFADAGLLGEDTRSFQIFDTIPSTFEKYKTEKSNYYYAYLRHSGGQAMIFSIIDVMGGGIPVFRAFAALFLAVVLAFWLMWVEIYFGNAIWFLVPLIMLNRWLVIFATTLSYLLGSYFLVMVALLWAYEKKAKSICFIVCITFLMEILLSGWKFLIPVAISAFIPLIFYRENLSKKITATMCGITFAIFFALAILYHQGATALMQRTTINPELPTKHFSNEIIKRSDFNIINKDCENPLIPHNRRDLFIKSIQARSGYISIFILASIFAIPFLKDRIFKALFWTTWFSILCPLSWVVIMAPQVAVHFTVDNLVWDMPFSLWVMLLTIIFVKKITKRHNNHGEIRCRQNISLVPM
jgi:hypothetical protein